MGDSRLMSVTKAGRKIRALYLQPAPLFGGAERQAASVASLLPELGVDVLPMVGPGEVIVDWLKERGVREIVHTRAFPGGWPKQRGFYRLSLPWRYFRCGLRARREIAEIVRTRQIDIVLASLPFAWFTGALVARRAGIPIIWRAGGARINIAQKVALWLVTRFLRPNLLLCTGEAVRKTFSPLVPAPAVVVQNGVDAATFHPSAGDRRRFLPSGAKKVVGCAVRLTHAKRPDDFIALAARLRARYPSVQFLLAGNGSRRSALEQAARRQGAENLSFLGFVSDMPSFYAACDVIVLPSASEGCPNVVLEAMAMGKSVIAADVAPVLELIGSAECALTYSLGNVSELAQAVALLLDRPELCQTLAVRGRLHTLGLAARSNAARLAEIMLRLISESAMKPARAEAKAHPLHAATESSWKPAPLRSDISHPRIPQPDP